jgi:hypothetical protein
MNFAFDYEYSLKNFRSLQNLGLFCALSVLKLAYQQREEEANESKHDANSIYIYIHNYNSYTNTYSITTLYSIDLELSAFSSSSLLIRRSKSNLCDTEIIFLTSLL